MVFSIVTNLFFQPQTVEHSWSIISDLILTFPQHSCVLLLYFDKHNRCATKTHKLRVRRRSAVQMGHHGPWSALIRLLMNKSSLNDAVKTVVGRFWPRVSAYAMAQMACPSFMKWAGTCDLPFFWVTSPDP